MCPLDYYTDYNDDSKDYFEDVDRIQSYHPTLHPVSLFCFYAMRECCVHFQSSIFLYHYIVFTSKQ